MDEIPVLRKRSVSSSLWSVTVRLLDLFCAALTIVIFPWFWFCFVSLSL
jgi:hypothetical protein